jgi:hypothetical protein
MSMRLKSSQRRINSLEQSTWKSMVVLCQKETASISSNGQIIRKTEGPISTITTCQDFIQMIAFLMLIKK